MKANKFLTLFLALSMLLLAGCSPSAPAGDGSGVVDNTAAFINYAQDVELVTMDSQIATDGLSYTIIAACNEGLYTVDKDNVFVPAIAESLEISEDGLTYVFTIREDAKWNDGTAVTAADFVFAWQRLCDPDTASEYQFFIADCSGIKNAAAIAYEGMDPSELGATAIDERTLEVVLERPCPYFMALIVFPPMYAVKEEFYNIHGNQYGQTKDNVLANGAYMVTYWEQGGPKVTVEPNPYYYDKDNVTCPGVNFIVAKDSQSAALAYERGEIDICTLSGEMVDLYKDTAGFQIVPGNYLWYLSLNYDLEVFQNANLRLAIATSFDKEEMCEFVLKDGSVAANFTIPHGLAASDEGHDFRFDSTDGLHYDPEAALAYWEAAKAELGIDSLSLTMHVEDTASAQDVATYIQDSIQKNLPGVKVTLAVMPKSARLEQMRDGKFEFGLTRWGADYADPMSYLGQFTTATAKYGWKNAEFDQLLIDIDAGIYATDVDARWEAMIKAEQMMLDGVAIMPVYQKNDATLQNPNVTGVEFHPVFFRIFQRATKVVG